MLKFKMLKWPMGGEKEEVAVEEWDDYKASPVDIGDHVCELMDQFPTATHVWVYNPDCGEETGDLYDRAGYWML